MAFLRSILNSEKLGRYLAIVAILLASPALFHGLEVDDRLQRIGALHQGKLAYLGRNPINLYTFLDGNPDFTQSLVDRGIATWWTDADARLRFFRPISSLFLWADHHVLKLPWLMHVHSMLWYIATALVALALYRRFLGKTWVAGLAGLMFTIDHTHGLPVSWIAQRNTLISGFFGLLTIYFHDRAQRDEGRSREAIFAAMSLGAALFSAEAALAILPYLFVHAWVYARPRWVRALAPHTLPVLLWLFCYKIGGFGAHSSGVYIDPLDAPLSYTANVFRNAPLLIATELGLPGADFYPFLPLYAKVVMISLAIGAVALFLVVLAPLLRQDRHTRFFVFGGLFAILPACATIPGSRLTFLTSFGVLGAVAQVVAGWRDGESWIPRRGLAYWRSLPVLLWCGLGHIFLSPMAFVLSLHQMTIFESIVTRLANGLPDDERMESQRLIVVNAPEPAFCAYVMIIRSDEGRPTPGKMLAMAGGARDLELTRIDAQSVRLSSPVGLVQPGPDLLSRSDRPFKIGERFHLSDVSIEVTRINEGGWPLEATFMFAQPLENEGYRWMKWKDQTLAPLDIPKIGESLVFPGQIIQLL